MIADVLSNKKFNSLVTKLLVRGRKLNICLAFITQFYFAVPKKLTKFHALFYFENFKETRTSTNHI